MKKLLLKHYGYFYCPDCRQTTKYKRCLKAASKKVYGFIKRPYFYREPTVACTLCGGVYDEIMTRSSPAITKEAYFPLIKKIMILMMMADGRQADKEADNLITIYETIAGQRLSRKDIDEEIKVIERQDEHLKEYLGRIVPYLNPLGKHEIVKVACYIAMSDGVIQDAEKKLLSDIVSFLSLNPGYYESVLEEIKNTPSQED